MMHFHYEKGWTGQGLYDRMMELRSQHTLEEISDKDILERVLGRHSMRLKGRARSPSISTKIDASDSSTNRPTYDDFASQLTATQNQFSDIEDTLQVQDFMLPPPPTPVADQHSGPTFQQHFRFCPPDLNTESSPHTDPTSPVHPSVSTQLPLHDSSSLLLVMFYV